MRKFCDCVFSQKNKSSKYLHFPSILLEERKKERERRKERERERTRERERKKEKVRERTRENLDEMFVIGSTKYTFERVFLNFKRKE